MNIEQKNIITELKEISPFLLSIRKAEGFAIPKNYFIDLGTDLVDRIEDHAILPDYLKEKIAEGFFCPKNYFEQLSDGIQDEIEDDQQLPAFLKSKKVEGYQVPANYFEALSDDLVAKIELEIALSEEEKQDGFGVPEGYFEKLPSVIIDKIKEGKEDNAAVVSMETTPIKVKPLWHRYNLIGSVAAIGILLLIGFQFLSKEAVDVPINLSDEQALAYLMEEDLDLEQDILNDYSVKEIDDIFQETFLTEELDINLDDIDLDDLDLEEFDF